MLTRFAPRFALSGREQILLYIMLSIGSPLAGMGLVHFIFSVVMAPGYHATPENHWDLFLSSYPSWFGILDRVAVAALLGGQCRRCAVGLVVAAVAGLVGVRAGPQRWGCTAWSSWSTSSGSGTSG
ncbi:MAG: hypothetical protein M5U09_27960 [Gammaproteobacteria bacterium]|nr:hypothetical protein [Gammaproteobacteria bacterium]